MIMTPIDVACAIILKDEKILVAQRSEFMSLPLKWEFPGGKVKPNESEENCLKRELKEELNIVIKIKKRLISNVYDYDNFSINLIPFIVEYESGDIRLIEHRAVKFFSKEELLEIDLAPADIPVLNQLLQLRVL
jgi:8-oxo-dGTP diphosphatase